MSADDGQNYQNKSLRFSWPRPGPNCLMAVSRSISRSVAADSTVLDPRKEPDGAGNRCGNRQHVVGAASGGRLSYFTWPNNGLKKIP